MLYFLLISHLIGTILTIIDELSNPIWESIFERNSYVWPKEEMLREIELG